MSNNTKLLLANECEIGMKVELIESNYIPDVTNPVKGSMSQCTGIITSISLETDHPIRVKWNSGFGNVYRNNELSLASKDDTVKYQSIWKG